MAVNMCVCVCVRARAVYIRHIVDSHRQYKEIVSNVRAIRSYEI